MIPELPGTFPIKGEELDARSSEIYELPDSTVDGNTKFDSRLSSLRAPFDDRLPEYPVIGQVEQLDSPLQQPGDGAIMADGKFSNGLLPTPQRGGLSVSEPDKNMATVKESSSPKSRKGSKTSISPSTNDIVIAIFGLTGSGKSSFISKLTGKEVKIGHGLQSCE